MNILWPVVDLYKGENQLVSIMSISSTLKANGHISEVVEADYRSVKRKLDRIPGPVIVAFSTPSVFAEPFTALNRRLKEQHDILSVFGGPHPTYFPEMIDEEGVDAICRGEGEAAMLDVVGAHASGGPLREIANWWVKENGNVYRNPLRPLVEDLDALPLPDHEIFRKAVPRSIWHAAVITGRGCPYECTYCFNHVCKKLYQGKGRYVRRRSADSVLEELRLIQSHKCYRFIKFGDDIFTLSPAWLEEFLPRYKQDIDLPFSCLARANHVNPRILDLLKSAGCHRITVGIESGNDDVRNRILKRNMSRDAILQACRLVKEYGIRLQTANILGIPGGSLEADLETLDLNIQCRSDYSGVTLLQLYHRTEIYDWAESLGMIDPQANLRTHAFRHTSLLKFDNPLEKRKVENLQKLFPVTVAFPRLRPLVKYLIRFPRNPVYDFIFSRWVNYCQYFRIVPARIGIRTIWKRSRWYARAVKLFSRA